MKENNIVSKIFSIISTLILLVMLFITFNIYKTNSFAGFTKAEYKRGNTSFTRDKSVTYGDSERSFKMESQDYNDAIFYKEMEVTPNTPYKISCMVKTENVENNQNVSDAGAIISIFETTEVSKAITGTNDWQKLEMYVDSKNNTVLPIGFRLGGNMAETKGTAWFADIKVERGIKSETTNWHVGCFIFNIETEDYKINTTVQDRRNTKTDMARFADSCQELSAGKMTVTYEIKEIDEPVKTLTYTEDFGYSISPQDVQHIIGEDILNNEYDYVFIVARMETPQGIQILQNDINWIGLGKMDLYGVGFSNIRLNDDYNNIYSAVTNRFHEEVYIHEFLHTLERNLEERNYIIPALHSNEDYGYKNDYAVNLKEWYRDYMNKNILDTTTNTLIGLDSIVYNTQPAHRSDFEFALEEEFMREPKNLIEYIKGALAILKNI